MKKGNGRLRARRRWSDEELLAGLRRFAAVRRRRRERKGGGFTVMEFDAWGARPFSIGTVIRRFGSWRAALGRIGIGGGRAKRYENAELVAEYERVWREMGRRPGYASLRKRGRYSANAYRARWGSLVRLGEMMCACQRGEITREDVERGCVEARPPRRALRVSERFAVLERDRYTCVLCGASPAKDAAAGLPARTELHVDHIVPVSRGGTNEIGNLRTLCRACNQGRGGRGWGEEVRDRHIAPGG